MVLAPVWLVLGVLTVILVCFPLALEVFLLRFVFHWISLGTGRTLFILMKKMSMW